MRELESSRHLFQPPLYRDENGGWHSQFSDALTACGDKVTIDPASIASFLSFGWVCGDRTMLHEIKRRPWLSSIGTDGNPMLEKIPEHGRVWQPTSRIAEKFLQLVYEEAVEVCRGRKEIYLLLSGGMDSRIVAGVVARLFREGKLICNPVAVTWGLADSRDAHYGRTIAKLLGFEWHHIDLSPKNIPDNIKAAAYDLGCMHTPECMHSTLWFKSLPKDALVLAGSYGDSIGRAEFAGKHLLELDHFTISNKFGLLKPGVFGYSFEQLSGEFKTLHNRAPGYPKHALCEHEMQGFRMRGGLGHAMTIINRFCYVYQMYTAPDVYEYMWSIHPSLRNDDIYATVLENINEKLARMPWARTNRALQGPTEGALPELRMHYHEYTKWSSGPLYDELSQYIRPDWYEATGVFDAEKIRQLSKQVHYSQARVGRLNEVWLWLAAFRRFIEHLEKAGKSIAYGINHKDLPHRGIWQVPKKIKKNVILLPSKLSVLNILLRRLRDLYRKINKYFLMRRAIREFPPDNID